ncbi:glutaredoxin-1-like [Protopterus annectens]|uniref:glutaredoxin-1-like n=1 Tax=Protopterus annectens TaxID=7888 RepID=UPI001CFBD7B7|nr:glutaredoxin-1-like [Protopterus annectens]
MAEFVNAKIKGDKVVVFSKPTCPYCQMAVEKQYSFKPGCLDIIDISSLSDMSGIQDYLQQLTGARTVSTGVFLCICVFATALRLLTSGLSYMRFASARKRL